MNKHLVFILALLLVLPITFGVISGSLSNSEWVSSNFWSTDYQIIGDLSCFEDEIPVYSMVHDVWYCDDPVSELNESLRDYVNDNYLNLSGSNANQDINIGNYDFKANEINSSKLYLGENGVPANFQFWLQERESLNNNRIMMYGKADAAGSYGYVISPSDTTGKDMYANLWDRDFDNAAVSDGYYAGTQLDTSEGGNMRLFTGVKSGTSYTAGDIKISPNYWSNEDLASFNEDDTIDFHGNLTAQSRISATDDLGSPWASEVVLEHYEDTWAESGAIRYLGGGFDYAGWEMQYGSTGMTNLYNGMAGGISLEADGWVSDDVYLTTQSGTSQDLNLRADGGDVVMNDNMRMSFGSGSGFSANRPRDASIYYTTSGVDGLHIDANRVNVDDELVIDSDIYMYSSAPDDRVFSLQTDHNLSSGFNTAVFTETRAMDGTTASGNLASITAGVYKNGIGDLTSDYALRGLNTFVDLNYFSGSSGDIGGAMAQHVILLENSDNYNGTLDKYSGTLYRTNAAGGGQVNVTDFAYIRALPSSRPEAVNNSGIIIGDMTDADNNYVWQSGLGLAHYEDDVQIDGVLYVNEINASSGSLKIYNSTGWGNLEAGNITTHTIVDNSTDALEYFQNGNYYLNEDGTINHAAFGELNVKSTIRDFANPQYTYTKKKVCEDMPETIQVNVTNCNKERVFIGIKINETTKEPYPIFEIIENCINETEDRVIQKTVCQDVVDVSVTYPEIEVEGILLNGQVAKISQAMGLLNRNIDLYENLTDFDTGIMAENMYFQSKAVSPDVDYTSVFSDIVPFTSKHKSKYATNLTLQDKSSVLADNVEDQIKDLQGYVLQNEFCRINNKKWDDYNICMSNGETLGQKK